MPVQQWFMECPEGGFGGSFPDAGLWENEDRRMTHLCNDMDLQVSRIC
jgi:hypothetical protein